MPRPGAPGGLILAAAATLALGGSACRGEDPTATATPSDTPANPSAAYTPSPTDPPVTVPPPTAAPTSAQATPTATVAPTPTATPTLSYEERLCEGAPVITWETFGRGFTTENCQSCHASTAPNRYGAPPGVTFDTHDDVVMWKDRMIVRATGDAPTMPPGGGVSADDRYRLEVWLRCWEP